MRWTILLTVALLLNGCGAGESQPDTTSQISQPQPPVIQPPPPPVIIPPPEAATTRTWIFHGQLANGGTVDGTFSYEKDAAPSAEQVHGLTPNAVYPLTAWAIEARINFTGTGIVGLPSVVNFSHTGFVDTSELCFNHCFLDPRDVARLVFDNGMQTLVLVFILPAPHTTLPVEVGDWGTFEPRASYVQSGNPSDETFQYRIVVTESELVAG
jgi:hypothetical protein